MLSQQLLEELQEILEQECSKKFEKNKVMRIANNLLGYFEVLTKTSLNKKDGKNRLHKKDGRNTKKGIQ